MQLYEKFRTIIGESRYAGYPCTLVRFAGCNLNCTYCDTQYANETLGEIVNSKQLALSIEDRWVLVTGGEPLLQESIGTFLETLIQGKHKIVLETNGTCDISTVPQEIYTIMDIKTPSSGMTERNMYGNLLLLDPRDEVKFLIADDDDFNFALSIIDDYQLDKSTGLSFSPVWKTIPPDILAEKILKTRLPIRLNLQLHKLIGLR
jgi:7-carboxy-7-deazaguanine synthase